MNKQRRAKIADVFNKLTELSAELNSLKDEEQDYYDNMPESFQTGAKGEVVQGYVDTLQDAFESIEYASNLLSELE